MITKKEKEYLKDHFCLGCGKSCNLDEPTCSRGYENMLKALKKYQEKQSNNKMKEKK
ncbi:MAG: hypothetical protein PHH04_02740 [Thomasclavelia sp.]|nr:hypothetical protein [Thomasclavelia sp.]